MNQYQIHNLFPTPLFVHDDISTTEKQRDFVYAQKWYRPPADNGWLTNNHYLLDEPVMKTLKEKIMTAFNLFIREQMGIPERMGFRMTNSWAVKHTQGDWGQSHIHTNCVFSGVYYLDTNPNTGNIYFTREVNNHTLPMTFRPGEFTKRTDYNTDEHMVGSINDRLVIFPSNLHHRIGENNSDWDRYSIAFNFFPTGHWGENEHELVL
jgi:uncharacterized protein (TIGR02466 family)